VETRIISHGGLYNADLREVRWTRPDRQRIDLEGQATSDIGPLAVAIHKRRVTRLDQGTFWVIDFADSSYTEVSFDEWRSGRALLDSLLAGASGPNFALGARVPLGAGDRICGAATERVERHDRPTESALGGSSRPRLVKWWEARELPGLELIARFEARRDSIVGHAAEGVAGALGLDDLDGIDAIWGPRTGASPAYPMRVITGLVVPDSLLGTLADERMRDPSAAGARFDLENRLAMSARAEVERFERSEVPDSSFDLPAGLKRKPSGLKMMLDLLKSPGTPGGTGER
jgi:hypothetical protein